jgi:isoquinoline 1-oxidoreductase
VNSVGANRDAALDAARISRAVGKTVKPTWTRKEEMTWAYFRPGGLIEVARKAAPDGTITDAWRSTVCRGLPTCR